MRTLLKQVEGTADLASLICILSSRDQNNYNLNRGGRGWGG